MSMKRLLRRWPIVLALLLALLSAFSFWRMRAVPRLLPSQQAAERWKGDGERDFAQHSFFLPAEEKLTRDQVYSFRNDMLQKLKGASYDIENEKGLFTDAWSLSAPVKVSAGRRSGEVQAFAVGGNFFDFHPLRLLSGNYLRPGDLMEDRVLLDRETAWLLFGAVDLAGMSFSIGGTPFVVAGVYEHEKDGFSKAALTDGMCIYMSYDAFIRLFPENTGISCYELVMAEPVKGFAHGAAEEKFPVKKAELTDNSYRYSVDRLLKILKAGSARSMHKGSTIYPYWENAARAAEDRAALWLAVGLVSGAFPAALALAELIRGFVRGRRKMETDVLPEAQARGREYIRELKRRRWERRHPGEY